MVFSIYWYRYSGAVGLVQVLFSNLTPNNLAAMTVSTNQIVESYHVPKQTHATSPIPMKVHNVTLLYLPFRVYLI